MDYELCDEAKADIFRYIYLDREYKRLRELENYYFYNMECENFSSVAVRFFTDTLEMQDVVVAQKRELEKKLFG
ncbi:MAG TPA: hypothetical protein PLV82_04170 [bacterium]|nr:hypothetical protein [bacterium]